MNTTEIKDLFGKFGASLDREDVWQVQSAVVIKHKALERLAVAARISFDKPTVLRAERDEAVILVHGTMCAADNKNGGETRHEWSIGEALVNVNYKVSGKQAGYVYAMAEKRAKDRVILKLAGLHGLYSEDEADEFKESSSAPAPGRNAPAAVNRTSSAGATLSADAQIARIKQFDLISEMLAWANWEEVDAAYRKLSPVDQDRVSAAFKQRQAEIEGTTEKAA
jgi:hypothetical protein